MQNPHWLSQTQSRELAEEHGTPFFAYSKKLLRERAGLLMNLKAPYGLTVRYAIKANPHPEIIKLFAAGGLHFDASSSYEAMHLIGQGIEGDKISLSSQQPAHNLDELLRAGVRFVATSMRQLELFAAAARPGSHVALRVNAGIGSGHNNRNKTGGRSSAFGLWHEYVDDALELARRHNLVVDRLHVHIGSGGDPAVWDRAIRTSLAVAQRMPDVTALDIGGGYKVERFAGEKEADMGRIFEIFSKRLSEFAEQTGRQLHLEIEPGTWLVAHNGCLVSEIVDIVDTGEEGYTFLRLDTGMNDFIRPAMYGSQHRLRVLNDTKDQAEYVVVGHACESSDLITTAPGDPEKIEPRTLNKAKIGDLLLIEDTGAYCAAMCAVGYNSYPSAKQIFV